MKLQVSTLIALYAVLELARDSSRQLSVSEIAERYGISTHHLAKVMRRLVREGLVQSVRGAGGRRHAVRGAEPDSSTAGAVLEAVGDRLDGSNVLPTQAGSVRLCRWGIRPEHGRSTP